MCEEACESCKIKLLYIVSGGFKRIFFCVSGHRSSDLLSLLCPLSPVCKDQTKNGKIHSNTNLYLDMLNFIKN